MNIPYEDESPTVVADCAHDEIEIIEDPACLFVWSAMPDFPLDPQPTVRRCSECSSVWIRVSQSQSTAIAMMRSLGRPAIRMVAR